jgi:hypothetical protein
LGKLIGFVLFPFNAPYLETNRYVSLVRIRKKAAIERFSSNKNIKHAMPGSFLAHGLTQKEA